MDWIRAVDYSAWSLLATSLADACHASQLTRPFVQFSGFSLSPAICSQYFSMALMTTIWFKGEPHSIASVTFSTFVLLIFSLVGYVDLTASPSTQKARTLWGASCVVIRKKSRVGEGFVPRNELDLFRRADRESIGRMLGSCMSCPRPRRCACI